ncbi:hypothetical protein EYF80_032267 [Liparis tanakae]|uniref:Uncharacterized protein n=1 Tax=Liparis tanakae TaxID=230148 RepID=A0A4Z2GXP4_9TELE|nr:hypothetical protein EYF80_032267 [Liparis tanakae]
MSGEEGRKGGGEGRKVLEVIQQPRPRPPAAAMQPYAAKERLSIRTLRVVPCSLQSRGMAAC